MVLCCAQYDPGVSTDHVQLTASPLHSGQLNEVHMQILTLSHKTHPSHFLRAVSAKQTLLIPQLFKTTVNFTGTE